MSFPDNTSLGGGTTSSANFEILSASLSSGVSDVHAPQPQPNFHTGSAQHIVEQQNSGQAGSENSPSLRCFKDAIESSSGGSSARVRLDPANLEDVASKPVAQTPFVQALNTLLSLVGTGRFPINETQLSDFTHDCTEEEVNAISDALEAASTHYDKTYGLKDQHGNLQRNEQKEICFKDDAPHRHQIFRQALELLLEEPEASDAESVDAETVLGRQSPRTDNALPAVAVSSIEEAEDNSQRTIKVSSGPTFFRDAFQRHAKVIKEADDFNSAIEELSDQLKSQDFDVVKFLADKDLSESKKQEIRTFVKENETDPSLSIKVLRLKKIVNPKQDSIKHWIGSKFAMPTTSIKPSCPSMPTKQDIRDAFFSKNFNLAKAIFKLDKVDCTGGNWLSNLLNKHINDHSHSEPVRTLIAGVTLIAGCIFALCRAAKWALVHFIGVLANVITLALPPIVLIATGAAIIGLCIFNPFAGVAAILGICVLVLIANQYKLSNQMKDLKNENERILDILEGRNKKLPASSLADNAPEVSDADQGKESRDEIAKLQNPRRVSAASSKSQSGSNTPRSVNENGDSDDGAPLDEDVVQIAAGQNAERADADHADDGPEGFEEE